MAKQETNNHETGADCSEIDYTGRHIHFGCPHMSEDDVQHLTNVISQKIIKDLKSEVLPELVQSVAEKAQSQLIQSMYAALGKQTWSAGKTLFVRILFILGIVVIVASTKLPKIS